MLECKKKTQTSLQNRNRPIDMENKLMNTKGEMGEGYIRSFELTCIYTCICKIDNQQGPLV